MTLPKRNHDRSLMAAQWVVVGLALGVWWPAFVTTYAMTDDYAFLKQWCQPDFDLWTSGVVRMGRPLAALLTRLEFLAYDHVADLASIRLLSACCLILFGVLLLRWLVEAGWSLGKSLLTTLLVMMTPPFVIFVGWAAMCNATFGAVFALWGSRIYLRRCLWCDAHAKGGRWMAIGSAAAAIFVAASFYQPTVCFFWLLPLATILEKPALMRTRWRALGGSIGVFVSALGFYYIAFALTTRWILTPNWATQRGALVSDLGGKLTTLFHVPVIDILGLWWTLSKNAETEPVWMLGLAVTIVALAGALYRSRSVWPAIALGGMILGMIGLTFTPLVAVESNASPFRTLGAPTAAWLILLVGGLASLLRSTAWRAIGLTALGAFTIGVIRQASIGLREGIVELHHREWSVVNNLLQETVEAETKSIVYRIPFAWHDSTHLRPYHEFTNPSTMTTWGIEGLVHMHYRERFPRKPERAPMVYSIYPWAPLPQCEVTLVDGYRALSGDAGTPPPRFIWNENGYDRWQIPPFGRVTYHGDNWIETERMGVAWIFKLPTPDRSTDPPRVSMGSSEGIFFYLLCEDSVFWTSSEVYPAIVKMETDQWYRLEEGQTGAPTLTPYAKDN